MKSNKDFADDLDARDRLRRRGYVWTTCRHCRGMKEVGMRSRDGFRMVPCHACNQRGGSWEAPLMC